MGSLNLDPRSIDINTEMGLLIESEPLVSELVNGVLIDIPKNAYRLQLDDSGNISWHENVGDYEVVETKDR